MSGLAKAALAVLLAATSGAVRAGQPFPDVELVDHDGDAVRLHGDLLEGRIVVVNSFFTSCLAVCPKVTRRMKSVRRWLGPRLGREVHLLSFSVDPTTDTPERLRRYRERFDIDAEGWRFITGTPEHVDEALRALGFYSDMAETHAALILVGDEARGTWRRADGLGTRREVVRLVRETLRRARSETD